MAAKERISREEIYESLTNARDRREVIRWVIHDHVEVNDKVEKVFRLSIKDEDWETRVSTMLGCVKLNMVNMIPEIETLQLPKSTSSGLTKEELNILVGFKNVTLDLLRGAQVPDEPLKLETPEDKKRYLTRLVGRGSMKIMHDAFLLYTSLTFPEYPIQEFPEAYHPSVRQEGNQFFLGDIELRYIPNYTVFIGSSTISYHPVILSRVPEGTFVSKDPITYSQLILEDSMKTGDTDLAEVTWDEAKAFCNKLSTKTGIKISIPNSESWEIVIRGHNGRFYPWGNSYQENQFSIPNVWGLTNYGNHDGEWTSDSIKDGRVIVKGNDPNGRCAPMQFYDSNSVHPFRIILSGLPK